MTTIARATPEPPVMRRGVVSAGARLRLGFNAAGVIAQVKVKTGDVVERGRVLARLRDGGASATLSAARAQRDKAARDRKSATTLAASGSIPTAQSDDALSALQIADANANFAADALSQRQLVAPIAGTILERLAEPGEAVLPGMPVVVLDDTKRLVVKVGVTERELARLKPAQSASLVLDGDAAAPVPATIASIASAPREDGLYAVEVLPVTPGDGAASKDPAFRVGTLLTVRFEADHEERAIRVPLDALVTRDGKTWAFVVTAPGRAADAGNARATDAGAGEATVRIRELAVDRAQDKDVTVRRGLAEGDRIVREGAGFLEDGQVVRLLD